MSVRRAFYQQVRSFGYPVPRVSRAVVFPCQDDERASLSLVAFGCLEDIQLSNAKTKQLVRFDLVETLLLDTHVAQKSDYFQDWGLYLSLHKNYTECLAKVEN